MIYLSVSNADAIRAGTSAGLLPVEVPPTLTQDQREILAQQPERDGPVGRRITITPLVTELRLGLAAAIPAYLDRLAAESAAKHVRELAEASAAVAKCEAVMLDPARRREVLAANPPEYRLPCPTNIAVRWWEQNKHRYAAERDALLAQLAEEKRLAEAAREERNAAPVAALMAWADEHQSPTLAEMRRLEVGDVLAVAEGEFIAAHTPDGYSREAWDRSNSASPRCRPTLQEMAELRRILAVCEASGGILSDARLLRHTVTSDDDDGDEHYVAVDLLIVTPTGRKTRVARVIDADGDPGSNA